MTRKRIGGISFDDNMHSIRGIETLCDTKLSRIQLGEKEELTKAMTEEERRQKEEGSFPDLEGFRAISLKYSKNGIDRALALGQEDSVSYRSKPRSHMVESLTRVILRRKNTMIGSGEISSNTTSFGSGRQVERRRSIA
jgi:hypothetical protein